MRHAPAGSAPPASPVNTASSSSMVSSGGLNPGTVSTLRLRGNTRPCYNLIEVSGAHVDVWRKYPFHGQEKIIQFSTDTLAFEKYTARIEGEVTLRS